MEQDFNDYFEPEFSLEKDSYISALKRNIEKYMGYSGITMKELSETANIPFATLNNLLYSKTLKDCKISTVINLATAMGITVDELLGCGAMSKEEFDLISTMRRIPECTKFMINWYIDYQIKLSESFNFEKRKIINIMYPKIEQGGNILPSDDFRPLDITNFSSKTKARVFLGIYLSCDYYMPDFCPYDILLIGNDRPARPTEICVIVNFGRLYLARRIEQQSHNKTIVQYISLRDGLVQATEDEIDMIIGYVVDVYHDLRR